MTFLLTVVIVLAVTCDLEAMRYSQRCKWSNEGCTSNRQCCSGACELLHPGTNPRCTRSYMGQPCLFDFHCDSRMKCGKKYTCCSGHWGTCSEATDCCSPYHICRKMKGFVYSKCLPRPKTLLLPKSGNQKLGYELMYIICAVLFNMIKVVFTKVHVLL